MNTLHVRIVKKKQSKYGSDKKKYKLARTSAIAGNTILFNAVDNKIFAGYSICKKKKNKILAIYDLG